MARAKETEPAKAKVTKAARAPKAKRSPKAKEYVVRPCAACGDSGGRVGAYPSLDSTIVQMHARCFMDTHNCEREAVMNMTGGCESCGGAYVHGIRTVPQFPIGAGTDKWVHAHCWKKRGR
jgi:hypothetical protein